MLSFSKFCRHFGLTSFPFNTYTTEQELDYTRELFTAQGEYDPIIEAFNSGKSIIITGERGSGKTANPNQPSINSTSDGDWLAVSRILS